MGKKIRNALGGKYLVYKYRWYIFLLQHSFRTRDILARNPREAFKIAVMEYGDRVLSLYQTASISDCVFSCWKQMTK
jgi:hypothetical protein